MKDLAGRQHLRYNYTDQKFNLAKQNMPGVYSKKYSDHGNLRTEVYVERQLSKLKDYMSNKVKKMNFKSDRLSRETMFDAKRAQMMESATVGYKSKVNDHKQQDILQEQVATQKINEGFQDDSNAKTSFNFDLLTVGARNWDTSDKFSSGKTVLSYKNLHSNMSHDQLKKSQTVHDNKSIEQASAKIRAPDRIKEFYTKSADDNTLEDAQHDVFDQQSSLSGGSNGSKRPTNLIRSAIDTNDSITSSSILEA